MNYFFDTVESCEQIGQFEDEYVYDVEVADNSHTFIANDILVHNSLYMSYGQLLKTIKGYENMSIDQKRDIIVNIALKFLDNHNREFIDEYYKKRYGQSVHNFELETLNLSGVWGEVKKRYAQLLLWKDGKIFDLDKLPLKSKGLEIVKSSFPKKSREMLKNLFIFMLQNAGDKNLIFKLNQEVMKCRKEWMETDIETISGSVKVNSYFKYVKDDTGPVILYNAVDPNTGEDIKSTPWNTRALATYNHFCNYNKLSGEPVYGGMVKWYVIKSNVRTDQVNYFAYPPSSLPDWSQTYAPIDRVAMFQQTIIDPINRLLGSNNMPLLNKDGSIQISLF